MNWKKYVLCPVIVAVIVGLLGFGGNTMVNVWKLQQQVEDMQGQIARLTIAIWHKK